MENIHIHARPPYSLRNQNADTFWLICFETNCPNLWWPWILKSVDLIWLTRRLLSLLSLYRFCSDRGLVIQWWKKIENHFSYFHNQSLTYVTMNKPFDFDGCLMWSTSSIILKRVTPYTIGIYMHKIFFMKTQFVEIYMHCKYLTW